MSFQECAVLLAGLAELGRLRTAVEIHELCHNLDGSVSAEQFAAGCAQRQRELYGRAPDADQVQELTRRLTKSIPGSGQ